MLKNKDEALEAFKKFQTLVEKEAENKIKIFRTDRGRICLKEFYRVF